MPELHLQCRTSVSQRVFAPITLFSLAVALTACSGSSDVLPTAPSVTAGPTPLAAISDTGSGGDSHFFWLPPIAPATIYPGTFDAAVNPELRICAFANNACTGPTTVYTRLSSPAITVDTGAESYLLSWSTKPASITTGDYRAEVRIGGRLLGFADARVVSNRNDLGSVPAGFVGVQKGKSLTFAFRIENGIVASVTIAPRNSSVILGDTLHFFATVRDLHGAVLNGAPVTWMSRSSSVATINATGLATGVSTGIASILAASGGVVDSTSLTVRQVAVARVDVTPSDSVSLTVGDHFAFSATAFDAANNVLFGRHIAWTTANPSVITVSPDGLVTAIKGGFSYVVASSEGKSDSTLINVSPAVARVEVTPSDTVSLTVGDHFAFSATVFDAANNVLFGRQITWATSDSSVVAISPNGLVTANSRGFTRIVAISEGKLGTAFVDVKPAAITP